VSWFRRDRLIALALAGALPALAQVPPAERAPAERPPLPDFLKEPAKPPVQLPPAPVVPEGRLSAALRVFVERYRVTGATAFGAEELEKVLAPWTGRMVGNEELEEARLALTRHYVAAGYVNSGAVIPDQKIERGTVEIQVIEGRLVEIVETGAHGFRPGFIRDRLALGAGPPLNVNRLQERMQILLQNPQIERINAELQPGLKPGEAVLRVDATEGKRHSVGMQYANNRSPAVGAERMELAFGFRNALGLGESWGLRVGDSDGLEDWLASVAVPVGARDTMLSLRVEENRARVIEPPFDRIDIANRSRFTEVGIAHPVWRTLSREVALGAALTRRRNASFLLGQPFAFTPGLRDGRSTVSALRLSADWTDRSAESVFAARMTLNLGIDRFGATVSDAGNPDSKFRTTLVQLQWARRLPGEQGQILLRADLQRSNDVLLPSEKLGIGGASTVRGYRENTLVKDNGAILSAEYRRAVGKFAPLGLNLGEEDGLLEVAVFFDAGAGRDENEAGGGPRRLRAFGPGVRWTPVRGALVQLYKGFALDKVAVRDPKLPDRGVHFLFAWQAQF
jgi:hemolysin activation/secretion protein